MLHMSTARLYASVLPSDMDKISGATYCAARSSQLFRVMEVRCGMAAIAEGLRSELSLVRSPQKRTLFARVSRTERGWPQVHCRHTCAQDTNNWIHRRACVFGVTDTCGDPHIVANGSFGAKHLDSPKSAIFICGCSVESTMSMFSSFRSRWTMPAATQQLMGSRAAADGQPRSMSLVPDLLGSRWDWPCYFSYSDLTSAHQGCAGRLRHRVSA